MVYLYDRMYLLLRTMNNILCRLKLMMMALKNELLQLSFSNVTSNVALNHLYALTKIRYTHNTTDILMLFLQHLSAARFIYISQHADSSIFITHSKHQDLIYRIFIESLIQNNQSQRTHNSVSSQTINKLHMKLVINTYNIPQRNLSHQV